MKRGNPFYFLAFALAPLLFVLQSSERSEFIHQLSLTILKPVWVTSQGVSQFFSETGNNWSRFLNTFRNQGVLEAQIQELQGKLAGLDEFRKENERLRKLLNFKKELPLKTIPARVMARDLVPWRKTILIDRGSNQGIRKRMALVNAEGLVGRVVEVAPWSARAILLLDPEARVSVLFQESRDAALAEGDGSSWLRVTHIDREASVKVGDRVVSSGLGGVYPKGIPVGRVEMVGTEKDGLELFALVRPSVNFSKLEELLCVLSSPTDS